MLLLKGATGTVSRCTVTGNRPCGIAVAEGADPLVYANQIVDNTPYGLLVLDGGFGHIYSNTVARNDLAQIVLSHAAKVVVHDNTITAGANGVEVRFARRPPRPRLPFRANAADLSPPPLTSAPLF